MSDLAKELGAGSLTNDQVNALTHTSLNLREVIEHLGAPDEFVGVGASELSVACKDGLEELEKAFPFLLEGVEDV